MTETIRIATARVGAVNASFETCVLNLIVFEADLASAAARIWDRL